jgi:hypothetical protein
VVGQTTAPEGDAKERFGEGLALAGVRAGPQLSKEFVELALGGRVAFENWAQGFAEGAREPCQGVPRDKDPVATRRAKAFLGRKRRKNGQDR